MRDRGMTLTYSEHLRNDMYVSTPRVSSHVSFPQHLKNTKASAVRTGLHRLRNPLSPKNGTWPRAALRSKQSFPPKTAFASRAFVENPRASCARV